MLQPKTNRAPPSKARLAGLLWAGLVAALLTVPVATADDGKAVDIGYYALKPSIVSNLTGGPRFIRCDIQLMTEQADDIPLIQLHSPALRHHLLMLIAGSDGNVLKTPDGKEQFRQAALQSVRDQLEELAGRPIVDDLYFTAYYVK